MSLTIQELANSELAQIEFDENLRIKQKYTTTQPYELVLEEEGIENNQDGDNVANSEAKGIQEAENAEKSHAEVENTCEAIRLRVKTLLQSDKGKKNKRDKVLPELEKTPYLTLLTKLCDSNFDLQQLTSSEKAVLGFLPIHGDNRRLGDLLQKVAEKVVNTFAKENETELKIMDEAQKAVFTALVLNLQKGRKRSFNEFSIDLNFMKPDLCITPKKLGELVTKLKEENRNSTEELLKELGFTDEEIPEMNKRIIEAGKEAIVFYRKVGAEIAEGQRRFVAQDKMGVLRGSLFKIGPNLDDSQADLFALLDKAYSNEPDKQRYSAQILLQIRLLCLMITFHPVYEALIDSNDILSKFSHKFLKGTGEKEIEEPEEGHNTISQKNLEELLLKVSKGEATMKSVMEVLGDNPIFEYDRLNKPFTLRIFEDGMPPIHIDDIVREKDWESIMLKIITGEAAPDTIIDMLAGQGAIYGINKEDLVIPDKCEDFDKIEEVTKRIEYIKRICFRTASAMGCTDDQSNDELSEQGTNYHQLLPGQYKIVKKIHGDPDNEKSHDFSAFKVYMAVATKKGTTLRIEWRYIPWDTYLSSKSKKSLTSDIIYRLKKYLIFSKNAFRRSQNERFVNVVERLLDLLPQLEKAERISVKNGSARSQVQVP